MVSERALLVYRRALHILYITVNPPFSVVPGADLTIARSSKYNYSDHGMEWNDSGKISFYCRFKYYP